MIICMHAGEDFILDRLITLTFEPNDTGLTLPFRLLEDTIPEELESFRLFLSINETQTGLRISNNFTTLINIIDDDGKSDYSLMCIFIAK